MTDHSFTEILLPFKWIKLEWQNLLLSVYLPTNCISFTYIHWSKCKLYYNHMPKDTNWS